MKTQTAKQTRQKFKIEVDGTKALWQLIEDGEYGFKDGVINQNNFPIINPTKRTAIIELFHFGKDMSSEEAIVEMKKEGFRPAVIEELLALGAKHPELQRKFAINSLGSLMRYPIIHNRGVPTLRNLRSVEGDKKSLTSSFFEIGWSRDCRFAAVRE